MASWKLAARRGIENRYCGESFWNETETKHKTGVEQLSSNTPGMRNWLCGGSI